MEIRVYTGPKQGPKAANIDQLPLARDWMDDTYDRHAYHCFPMTLANRIGWGISFPEDIVFKWDGINDSTPEHVEILKGNEFAYSQRGNATISFVTGLRFETDENVSLLTMPVPNQFIRGAQCISTVISSSALIGDLPMAWMITEPNIEITIPAGTPVAAVIPMSLTNLQSYDLSIMSGVPAHVSTAEWNNRMKERARISMEMNGKGEWTHFYRNATDHTGEPIGKHETKKIIMKVTDLTDEK